MSALEFLIRHASRIQEVGFAPTWVHILVLAMTEARSKSDFRAEFGPSSLLGEMGNLVSRARQVDTGLKDVQLQDTVYALHDSRTPARKMSPFQASAACLQRRSNFLIVLFPNSNGYSRIWFRNTVTMNRLRT